MSGASSAHRPVVEVRMATNLRRHVLILSRHLTTVMKAKAAAMTKRLPKMPMVASGRRFWN
jgi:hypothetical protein